MPRPAGVLLAILPLLTAGLAKAQSDGTEQDERQNRETAAGDRMAGCSEGQAEDEHAPGRKDELAGSSRPLSWHGSLTKYVRTPPCHEARQAEDHSDVQFPPENRLKPATTGQFAGHLHVRRVAGLRTVGRQPVVTVRVDVTELGWNSTGAPRSVGRSSSNPPVTTTTHSVRTTG